MLLVKKDPFGEKVLETMLDDKQLIVSFKGGDSDALRAIYEKYKNDMLKLAVVLLNDVGVAEDVVQSVFVKFAQSADRIAVEGNLKSYLATSVVNDIRNRKRDGRRREMVSIDQCELLAATDQDPGHWIVLNEELELLREAMAVIPYEQREVIMLYLDGEMTFSQIGRLQGLSVNTVQGRYRYGMSKLRSLLKTEVQDGST